MVSKLESAFPKLEAPARREAPRRESTTAPTPEAMEDDADLRVTLSAAARRLATPPAVQDVSRDPIVSESGAAERPGSPRAVDAYREAARPVLGERLSIRV